MYLLLFRCNYVQVFVLHDEGGNGWKGETTVLKRREYWRPYVLYLLINTIFVILFLVPLRRPSSRFLLSGQSYSIYIEKRITCFHEYILFCKSEIKGISIQYWFCYILYFVLFNDRASSCLHIHGLFLIT